MIYLEEMSPDEKRALISRIGKSTEQMPNILLSLQRLSRCNALDGDTVRLVAEELDVSITRVLDLLGFYGMLSSHPGARYVLELCDSNPCRLRRGQTVADCLRRELGIEPYEVTEDGLFTIRYMNCAGACHIGPVIRVGDSIYGEMDEKKIHALLQKLRAGEEEQA